jgi:DNA-binding CsgD family transcriptional regulator
LPINYIFILLATLDGYTLKQMASVLGLAKSTVCYHRKRCKKLVRSIQKYDR